MKPDVDYYPIVKEFAEQHGFAVSCSNGVFKLGPTQVSVQHYLDTQDYQKEVADFKAEHPEYANMKCRKHQEPTSVIYGLELGNRDGASAHGTVRQAMLQRTLKQETMYGVESLIFLDHLFKNKYRFLNEDKLMEKFSDSTRLKTAMCELGLLDREYRGTKKKKSKHFLRLTNEGQKYVRQSRIKCPQRINPATTKTD